MLKRVIVKTSFLGATSTEGPRVRARLFGENGYDMSEELTIGVPSSSLDSTDLHFYVACRLLGTTNVQFESYTSTSRGYEILAQADMMVPDMFAHSSDRVKSVHKKN